jgi:hypothetical protein
MEKKDKYVTKKRKKASTDGPSGILEHLLASKP